MVTIPLYYLSLFLHVSAHNDLFSYLLLLLPPQVSEKKASEFEMMSGKLMKDVEKLEKSLDQAVSDMNDMNKLMETTLEFFSAG